MSRRSATAAWSGLFQRSLKALTRQATRSQAQATKAAASAVKKAVRRATAQAAQQVKQQVKQQVARQVARPKAPPAGSGDWLAGVALGPAGARRYRLYRPAGLRRGERLPLLVMLHGCGQDANAFAASTRMNRLAERERCLVLYPEQDRLANPQGCWNWYDTQRGRAQGEADLVLAAIDQVCLLYPADRARVVVAGLSAGASLAALLALRHPDRVAGVAMHSGVPPGTANSMLSALGAMRGRRATAALPASDAQAPSPQAAGAPGLLPPLLVIHGDADHVVDRRNGAAAVQAWAEAAGARAAAPRTVQRGKRRAMTVTDHRLRGRVVATLVEVAGLGHAWSGGAARQPFSDPSGPDASRLIWAFARRQFGR